MSKYSLSHPVIGINGYDNNLLKPSFSDDYHVGVTLFGDILDKSPQNIHFNALLLLRASVRVTPVAMRVYMALLMRLIRNDQPIYCTVNELRLSINFSKKSNRINDAIYELERERLVLRQQQDYNNFYINPLFAWTGDRRQYFDESTLPLIPEED